MKKSFKPASWIYPQPALVIVSQDKAGETDAMVVAGAASMTRTIGFMLDHNHKTTDNIPGNRRLHRQHGDPEDDGRS